MADVFEGYLSEHDFAVQRGVSRRTLQRERQLRNWPPFVATGRRILYPIEGIRQWLAVREVNPVAARAVDETAMRGALT